MLMFYYTIPEGVAVVFGGVAVVVGGVVVVVVGVAVVAEVETKPTAD